jgi:hypothetical protein
MGDYLRAILDSERLRVLAAILLPPFGDAKNLTSKADQLERDFLRLVFPPVLIEVLYHAALVDEASCASVCAAIQVVCHLVD